MCNPLAIGAVLATAVGTGLQVRAQRQREEDMNRAQRRETERQDSLYNESKTLLDQSREEYSRERVDADMATAAADRQSQYAAADRNAPRANEALPGSSPAGGNVVVLEAFRQAAADAAARAEQQGAARADLASFGDFMGDAAISTGRRSGDIGMLGSFSRGSANVLPLELNRIATRRRGAATAGNLLTSFGAAMMGGAGGGAAVGGASGLGGVSGIGAGLAGGTRYAPQATNLFAGLAGRG